MGTKGGSLSRRGLLLGAGAAAVASTSAHAARTKVVHVTVGEYSSKTGPYFVQMAKEFEATHPDTRVRIDAVDVQSLIQTLQTDISGGSSPDISLVWTRNLPAFVAGGLAEPLDHFMTPKFRDGFIPAFLKPSEFNGKLYGLPIAASARAMYYNKSLLAKAGFANGPSTWDDVVAAAKRVKAEGKYGYGIQGKDLETDVYWYYCLWSYGGAILDAQHKAAFNSPAGLTSLALYEMMVKNDLTEPGVTEYSRDEIGNLFKQGRVGMMIDAPFLMAQITTEAPHLEYGIVPVPKGTTRVTYAVTDSMVMFKSSRVKKEAWQFLEFIFSEKARLRFNKNEGFLPSTRAVAANPYFADNERLKVFVELLPKARFAPVIRGWDGVAKAVTDGLQSVYLGKATPAAALARMEKQANEALAEG